MILYFDILFSDITESIIRWHSSPSLQFCNRQKYFQVTTRVFEKVHNWTAKKIVLDRQGHYIWFFNFNCLDELNGFVVQLFVKLITFDSLFIQFCTSSNWYPQNQILLKLQSLHVFTECSAAFNWFTWHLNVG